MRRKPVQVVEIADRPVNKAVELYAQGVEPYNRCGVFYAENEVFDNTGRAFSVGLTAASVARFRAKVQQTDGCWLWTGATFRCGYGMFNAGRFRDGKQDTRYTHRVVYELAYGPIPEGLEVMHVCDVRHCVRPSHLRLGTHVDNMQDCAAKGRVFKGPRPAAKRGIKRPQLKPWQRDEIRRMRALGAPVKETAARFGISYQHACRVGTGSHKTSLEIGRELSAAYLRNAEGA